MTCSLFFEQENCSGVFFKLEMSNISTNLWSDILDFTPANLWYSSKIEDRHHFCSFRKHPTRHPVRCCIRKIVWYITCEMQLYNNLKTKRGKWAIKQAYLSTLAMYKNWVVSCVCYIGKEKKMSCGCNLHMIMNNALTIGNRNNHEFQSMSP